ncbi:MAG: hypothetical protein JWN46_351 [Acidimicrobiales bacterium]|nr:hypothetical protein [Acidimicrobiales bacterium]
MSREPLPANRHPLDVGALIAATILGSVAALGLLQGRVSLHAQLTWLWPAASMAIAATLFGSLVGYLHSTDQRRSDAPDDARPGQVRTGRRGPRGRYRTR